MPKDNPFVVGEGMLQQIAQGLLEMKKMARSIENSADAFRPLVDDPEVDQILANAIASARNLADDFSKIYRQIAREAALGA